MGSASHIESEINSWLQVILKGEHLNNLSTNIVGNTETGDGYLGDIIFVTASGTTESGSTKSYSLILKCSKRSEAFRKQSMAVAAFLNEIYMYDTLLPLFTQFQLDRGVMNYFNSVPKCYGTFIGENMEVIALDNFKELGYVLWEKKKPLPRSHIDKIIKEYGKFHATSIALQQLQPETFQEIEKHFRTIGDEFRRKNDVKTYFYISIDDVYNLLKNDFEENVMKRWKDLKEDSEIEEIYKEAKVKVITHGDCWNNNFMYRYDDSDTKIPTKVAIIDWQMSTLNTPIVDLSYFIFASISKYDLEDLENILGNYHKTFSQHLKKFGIDADSVYSYPQLLKDWKKFCKFGVLVAGIVLKICSTDKDEVVDAKESAEKGIDFGQTFRYEIRDKENFRNRMKPIFQYAVDHEII